jgi:hypothetical protein
MKKYHLSIIIATILIIVNCSTAPPTRANKESSIIAINIYLQTHTSLLTMDTFQPEKIYFIKIEDGNTLKVNKIIASNYCTESWNPGPARYTVYLMGAEPGKYAAVAASGIGHGSKKTMMVFFPEKVINSSIVMIQPKSIAYMGHFYLTTGKLTNGMEGADELQKHYYTLLTDVYGAQYVKKNVLLPPRFFAPQEKETYNSEEFRKEFIKSKASEFKNTEWKDVIK